MSARRRISGQRSRTTADLVSPRLFWGALAIAAIVLLGLISRLLKKPA